jgi:malic enzyme
MALRKEALELHHNYARDLSLAYSSGVAEPCREIIQQREFVYEYTNKRAGSRMATAVAKAAQETGVALVGLEQGL